MARYLSNLIEGDIKMRIVVGRGKNDVTRHVFDVPPRTDRVGREQLSEDVKNFLFRPKLLTQG
jgi:hypothetical protein